METWMIITVAAAFLQNLRSALQKHLKDSVGTTGATFVRFGFGVPFAGIFLAILCIGAGEQLPVTSSRFFLWAAIGAGAQIWATFLLVYLFSFRNFVVGTAYSRTEPAQAALFGVVLLGELPRPMGLAAIAVTVLGVMLISVAHNRINPFILIGSLFSRTAAIGIASGTLFGLAAVAIRTASLELGGPNFLIQASFTLAVVIALQTAVMLAWLLVSDRPKLAAIRHAWRPALATGFFGATASLGWFAAMTLQQAALVKAVAQVEIVFTVAASLLFFREKINGREIAGTVMIVAGILLLLVPSMR
jgi:drug/metabolite transporter (DMT)-like permease